MNNHLSVFSTAHPVKGCRRWPPSWMGCESTPRHKHTHTHTSKAIWKHLSVLGLLGNQRNRITSTKHWKNISITHKHIKQPDLSHHAPLFCEYNPSITILEKIFKCVSEYFCLLTFQLTEHTGI